MSDTREADEILTLRHETADEICARVRADLKEHDAAKYYAGESRIQAMQFGALQVRYDNLRRDFIRCRDLLACEVGEPAEPDSCAECDQVAVGYDEGTPLCAAHYRSRPAHPSIAKD